MPPPPQKAAGRALAASSSTRVVVLVEENHEFNQIIGSPAAPFINALAAHATLLTSYYAVGHPSLPNYLVMLAGDSFGITSDCTTCSVAARNLVDQLEAAGVSWKAYLQALPSRCSTVAEAGAYAKRHNPFLYFDDIAGNPSRCTKVAPFAEFAADVRAGRLPRLAFVVPDLLHDMHDGSVSDADRWAAELYRQLATSSVWRQDTRLVLTFDEGKSHSGCCGRSVGGGHTVTVVAGPRVLPGVRDGASYNHYALLASLESLFHVGRLGHAADATTRLIPALR